MLEELREMRELSEVAVKKMMVLGILLTVAGCTSMGGMIEEKNTSEGTVETYPLSKAKALELAKIVMKEQGADSFEEGDGYVIGSFYVNLISPGSFCGVYPKEVSSGCEVRVVSRRKSSISIFTGLTETGFHDAFEAKLKSMASK